MRVFLESNVMVNNIECEEIIMACVKNGSTYLYTLHPVYMCQCAIRHDCISMDSEIIGNWDIVCKYVAVFIVVNLYSISDLGLIPYLFVSPILYRSYTYFLASFFLN